MISDKRRADYDEDSSSGDVFNIEVDEESDIPDGDSIGNSEAEDVGDVLHRDNNQTSNYVSTIRNPSFGSEALRNSNGFAMNESIN